MLTLTTSRAEAEFRAEVQVPLELGRCAKDRSSRLMLWKSATMFRTVYTNMTVSDEVAAELYGDED